MSDETQRVCTHPPASHFAHEGQCHDCGCSYYLADDGIEPVTIVPKSEPYSGFYVDKKWVV